jgi:hypothetical protein
MKDIDWDLLFRKKIDAPFLPPTNKENFDKKYCEGVDKVGEETIERYELYWQSDLYEGVFVNYTFVNMNYISKFDKKPKYRINSSNTNSKTKLSLNKDSKEKNDSKIKDNKNNSNNSNNKNEEIIADLDKISIKYELLKIEYERQKTDLEEKEKLLSDYNLTNLNDSKISSEEKINQIIKKYENKIEEMNQKHIKDILDLKINLPNCFTPSTHEILVDKKFKEYELHWYLLTITTAKKKDYENTFWVTEDEIKDSLEEFKQFKTEEDIEKENINIYAIAQEKLIKRIETNEDTISNLKKQIMKLKGEK